MSCGLCPSVIIMTPFFWGSDSTIFLTDGAECDAQLMKSGQSVAARLLAVIEDLEQAHATFQHREKEDGTSVILHP